ncbi:hypothetical protein MGG_05831 [Pyricularia oryzae 70-15]|uniref:Uncharacterized protein n=3 Tax=Pyricularia oryzae TaxID=318829 RepID=G4N3M7_PYRO7|nr:uncharacterized protein MGG_05831 [Pyricularia oryzae 70-15]EHA51851.1 hypothetical protein MGG_05831 [Pyricularia oryzae 70-15]ELQ40260.1 hypothetical protein OOU_Y34scaffold00453g3 [Pyricularia oryzae Y34]KAI7911440.1 hypothetical protein M9X92_010518 [Pyricularia oryzae]KAI7912803.1 hypothetical protein M0657_010303 [Pyricularia oryzae]
MQTSFATISQLMVVLLAAGTLAAPLSTTAAEEPKLEARRDSRCADEGFGCTQLCYPGTNKCGWVAIPPPRPKAAKREEAVQIDETVEVAEAPRLEARRDSRCADEGFGCTQRCYPGTNKCGWVAIPPPRAKTAKRDEVNETIEVAEAEADSGDAAPIEARQTCDRDRGFGCSYRCYGNQCTMVPNPPPRSG